MPPSVSSNNEERSAAARIWGNDLYRQGLFDQATKAYFEALSLSPNDPAPLSNLSALKFEQGDYSTSILYAERALKLMDHERDDSPKKQKLFLRITKAQLLLQQDATLAASKLQSIDTLHKSVAAMTESKSLESDRWAEVLNELPRYRPCLQNEPEYYPVGHDHASVEMDDDLIDSKQDLCWLFAGIGDARNFFVTVTQLIKLESAIHRRLHFTLLDLKPAAIAKLLIMLHLLGQPGNMEALACLMYVFGSVIMPPFAYDKLQQTIATLIRRLQEKETVETWIYLAQPQRQKIARHLCAWQENLYNRYDTQTFRRYGVANASQSVRNRFANTGEENRVPPFCERDDALFWTYGIVLPHEPILSKHEQDLSRMLAAFETDPEANSEPDQKVLNYIDQNWKPNVTLIDMDWDDVRTENRPDGPDFLFNPSAVASSFFAPDPDNAKSLGYVNLWAYFKLFFNLASKSIRCFRSQLCVELIVGEMNDCLERIHHGWSTRGEKQGTHNPQLFPRTYNRIHMSNVPDYVGGALTSFLFATPLLHTGKGSALTFRVLLNPRVFKTHEHFLNEYTLLPDLESVEKHFAVKLRKDSPALNQYNTSQFELSDYTMWATDSLETNCYYDGMSREMSEKYFPRTLSKDLHPESADKIQFWQVYILGDMVMGTISTTARAPKKVALKRQDIWRQNPCINTSIQPWVAELSTLTSIWKDLLPFGLLFDNDLIPALETVRKYRLAFPKPNEPELERPHFTLVFWDAKTGKPPSDLRRLLLDEEQGDRTTSARNIRQSSIHVLTTFTWTTKTTSASFWLRSDVVDRMQQGDWEVYVWRLDTWERVTGPASLRDLVQEKDSWGS